MSGIEALLWRTLHRVWIVLTIGVLGLMLGLDSRPDRGDSVLGVLIVLIVALPVVAAIWRMQPPARRALRQLPSHRPLLAVASVLLATVALLVLWWAVTNAVFPGTLSPLALALAGVVIAGIAVLLGRFVQRF